MLKCSNVFILFILINVYFIGKSLIEGKCIVWNLEVYDCIVFYRMGLGL